MLPKDLTAYQDRLTIHHASQYVDMDESPSKAEMKTYTWVDQMGWPRLATVVQFKIEDRPTSFLLVTAFQNNDNDSYSFSYEDGEFSITDKKLAPSWELPKGHLREDTK
jgi:hypothetical protein